MEYLYESELMNTSGGGIDVDINELVDQCMEENLLLLMAVVFKR